MPLNNKQKRFVSEYQIDQNATKAAIRSGYSVKSAKGQAYRLMHNKDVKKAIEMAQNKLAFKHDITKDMIVSELAKIAFHDIRKAYHWNNDEITIIESTKIDANTATAIAEVTSTKDGVKIKMLDKKAALMDLAKMLGYINERQENTELMNNKNDNKNGDFSNLKQIEYVIINDDDKTIQ